jgi:hypothetical protein
MKAVSCLSLVLLSSLAGEARALAEPDPPPAEPPAEGGAAPVHGGAAIQLLGAHNLLRSSYFNWTTSASTKTFGLGKDYIGTEDSPATMAFALVPRFSLLDTGKHWLRVGTRLAWGVELGGGDATTRDHSVVVADLPLDLAYDYTLLQQPGGLTLLAGPAVGVSFPTSSASRDQGKLATTRVGIGAALNAPLRGGDGWLDGLFVMVGMDWSHLFSRANQPTNTSANVALRPRLDVVSSTDQLAGGLFTHDTVSLHLSYWLNLWGDLSLGNGWGYEIPFKYSPASPACIKVSSGCAQPAPAPSLGSAIPVTAFDLSLGYAFARLVWAEIGYSNVSASLGEDGTRRSVFYSPEAQFYLSGTVFLDGALGRITRALHPEAPPAPLRPPPSTP